MMGIIQKAEATAVRPGRTPPGLRVSGKTSLTHTQGSLVQTGRLGEEEEYERAEEDTGWPVKRQLNNTPPEG